MATHPAPLKGQARGKKMALKVGTTFALSNRFGVLQAIHRSTLTTNHIPNPP